MYKQLREADLLKPISDLSPEEERSQELKAALLFMGKPEKMARIENKRIRQVVQDRTLEVPIRVYFPEKEGTTTRSSAKRPIILFIHGGGFIAGELRTVEECCCLIAKTADSIVVSVDYRLAPEHKFPQGLDDCYGAAIWVLGNAEALGGDPGKVIISGDSAGGNLATEVCLMLAKNQRIQRSLPAIALQFLVYPGVDLSWDMSKFSGVEYGPSKEEIDWMLKHYLSNPNDVTNPAVSPLLADIDGLSLPPAFIVTAEFDPLREQDIAYARKLEQSGVKVWQREYPGMVHGFFHLPSFFDEGRQATLELAKLARML